MPQLQLLTLNSQLFLPCLRGTDARSKSRGCLHTMPCKEEEDEVKVSEGREGLNSQLSIFAISEGRTKPA